MRNTSGLKKLFHKDRKTLYIILSIVIFLVLTLTVAYAALSTTLNINGHAEVSASSWDIYLDNIQLNSRSATQNIPTITDTRTATFSTTLNKPGDFYEFTVDVVNNGSIDAMIDSITKTPEFSTTQAKYLNYIVEYQNGESITTKQLVSKNSFVRLKIKVEYRKDITASDLPTTSETLNLSFRVNYVQSDDNGINVKDDGLFKLDIISGNTETVGSEVAIGDEHFYIISSNETSVTMLAKYNLYVGGKYESDWTPYGDEATGIQDSTMIGRLPDGSSLRNGTTPFAASAYWGRINSGDYIYDSRSTIYNYIENYRIYLESKGAPVEDARLIKIEELLALGCNREELSCSNAQEWVYGTSYWTGAANGSTTVWRVYSNAAFGSLSYASNMYFGVRPVIIIKRKD